MKREYDFGKGERGKFYASDAQFRIPVYLEPSVQAFVEELATRRGTDLSSVVNDLLKSDQKIAEYVRK